VRDRRRQVEQRAEYDALRTTAGVHLLPRDFVSVSGPDAESFLQGQCSQDVAALAVGETAEALLLSPQGKVDAYLRVTRSGDEGFVLDTDEGFGERIIARLQRFRLRTKVELGTVPWLCAAVRGPGAGGGMVGQPTFALPVERPGLSGVDLVGPRPDGGLGEWVSDDVIRCGDEAWEAARIEAGLPVNGREVTDTSIAAELGLVERTVSFTKGCFTGQELVARLDSRGSNVARRLRGLAFGGGAAPLSELPPLGATVLTADGSHEVGTLSSVAWSPGRGGAVALATLHRRITPPEVVQVRWPSPDPADPTDPTATTVTTEAEAHSLPMGF